MVQSILQSYGLHSDGLAVTAFGSGLINHTWRVKDAGKDYILQRVNDRVFERPQDITHNLRLISQYLRMHHPGYLFVVPVKTTEGHEMVYKAGEGYFRMFPFVAGSHTVDVVQSPLQAYEAAKQFGKFTSLLSGFDHERLRVTIPDFHDLSLRHRQFQHALKHGDSQRIKEARAAIKSINRHYSIVHHFEEIQANKGFKLRVTHHDAKISNVLFNESDQGLCVIDLDTVMPGYFISDVGDMLRTYLSRVSEEEREFSEIDIREEFFKAVVEGYSSEMKDELSALERKLFVYAGKYIIYMQALRFLTDHINNDTYYGAKYPGHNLLRAGNQLVLLQQLIEKEASLNSLTF